MWAFGPVPQSARTRAQATYREPRRSRVGARRGERGRQAPHREQRRRGARFERLTRAQAPPFMHLCALSSSCSSLVRTALLPSLPLVASITRLCTPVRARAHGTNAPKSYGLQVFTAVTSVSTSAEAARVLLCGGRALGEVCGCVPGKRAAAVAGTLPAALAPAARCPSVLFVRLSRATRRLHSIHNPSAFVSQAVGAEPTTRSTGRAAPKA